MTSETTGTLLTCSHIGCGCRMRIEVPCECPGAGQSYRCTCGADMVPVES